MARAVPLPEIPLSSSEKIALANAYQTLWDDPVAFSQWAAANLKKYTKTIPAFWGKPARVVLTREMWKALNTLPLFVNAKMPESYFNAYTAAIEAGSRDWPKFQRELVSRYNSFYGMDDAQYSAFFQTLINGSDLMALYRAIQEAGDFDRLAFLWQVPKSQFDAKVTEAYNLAEYGIDPGYVAPSNPYGIPDDVFTGPAPTASVRMPTGFTFDLAHPMDGRDWMLTNWGWLPASSMGDPSYIGYYLAKSNAPYTLIKQRADAPPINYGVNAPPIEEQREEYYETLEETAPPPAPPPATEITDEQIASFVSENYNNPKLVVETAEAYGLDMDRVIEAIENVSGISVDDEAAETYWTLGEQGSTYIPTNAAVPPAPPPVTAPAQTGIVSDADIYAYFQQNGANPKLVVEMAIQYGVTPQRLAIALNKPASLIASYWAQGMAGKTTYTASGAPSPAPAPAWNSSGIAVALAVASFLLTR